MSHNQDISVTIISHTFPSDPFPVSGVFVKDQVEHLAKQLDVNVIAPKPRSNALLALLKKRWKDFRLISSYQSFSEYELIRPDYISYPKRLFFKQTGKNFWRAIKRSLDKKPDIFHLHSAYPAGCIAVNLKKIFPDIKIFLSIHGNDWHFNKDDKHVKQIIYDNFKVIDKILTVGHDLKNDIIKYYPEFEDKIDVLHNGISIDDSLVSDMSDPFTSTDKIKIVMVGAFVKGKGVQVLLKALHDLDPNDYEVVIIGNMIDKKEFMHLEKLKNELSLSKNVTFKVSLERKRVFEHLKYCDYFILPSLKEGFGIALIEALIFGKPVISTLSGGPEEIVDEHNGLLVKPGNVDELKSAMMKMDRIYQHYDPMELKKTTIERFGMDRIILSLIHHYKESLN